MCVCVSMRVRARVCGWVGGCGWMGVLTVNTRVLTRVSTHTSNHTHIESPVLVSRFFALLFLLGDKVPLFSNAMLTQ